VRIAVYSDIHGNTPGLRAVHEQIDAAGGIDLEICLGDVVYGGPGTGDLVAMLRDRRAVLLLGNHDQDLVGFDAVLPTLEPDHRHAAAVWHRWLETRLTTGEVTYLASAPLTLRALLPDGTRVLFCHAAPSNNRVQLVGPDAEESDRALHLAEIDDEVLCTGHWHTPVFLSWRALRVACVGSVGMSADGLSRWMLIEADRDATRIVPCAARYDVDEFERLARACSMPDCPLPCVPPVSPGRPGAGPPSRRRCR
jgi:predicted phosphodiesterase